MHLNIKKLILAGLAALPAACATYPHSYYGSGYNSGYSSGGSYYYPGSYGSGYGVVERNYYNTYSYPTPVYRTETHHHHHDDHDRYDDHDGHRYQDNRRPLPAPGTFNRYPGSHAHDNNNHYNWNTQTAKPYGNRQNDWNHDRHDHQNEGRQRRPDEPNAHGQWQRQQNWGRQEASRQDNDFSGRASFQARSERQDNAQAPRDDRRGHREHRSRQFSERGE
ncbi:hypothetical protein [Methylomicrobium lacus]|uniref:hypothetical protein n=1 Tax=Methylomicrobium lacus TaxID=136992 RepID=UPI0035A990FF